MGRHLDVVTDETCRLLQASGIDIGQGQAAPLLREIERKRPADTRGCACDRRDLIRKNSHEILHLL